MNQRGVDVNDHGGGGGVPVGGWLRLCPLLSFYRGRKFSELSEVLRAVCLCFACILCTVCVRAGVRACVCGASARCLPHTVTFGSLSCARVFACVCVCDY